MSNINDFIIENGVLKKYTGSDAEIVIPDEVVKIGYKAFAYCECLQKVEIGSSVTEIGESAFLYCENLNTLTIPASVKEIGEAAFRFCKSLVNLNLDKSSENFVCENGCLIQKFYRNGENALNNALIFASPASEIVVPDQVRVIAPYAFIACEETEKIILPEFLNLILEGGFYGLNALKELKIPDGVKKIIGKQFTGYLQDATIEIPLSVEIEGEIFGERSRAFVVFYGWGYIPDLVKSAKNNYIKFWFQDCAYCEIPNNLKINAAMGYIEACERDLPCVKEKQEDYIKFIKKKRVAFYPAMMEKISLFNLMVSNRLIENSVVPEYIALADKNNDVFRKAALLEYNKGNIETDLFNLDKQDALILSADDAKVNWAYSTVELKDGTVGVGIDSYKGAESVVTVPTKIGKKAVLYINSQAFSPERERLAKQDKVRRLFVKEVVIPEGVVGIEDYAFAGCNIEKVTLPTTLRTIGKGAFASCVSLSEVKIPEGCQFGGSFVGCKLLENSSRMVIIDSKLDSCSATKKKSIQIPKSVTEICEYAFYNCSELEEIIFHNNIKKSATCIIKDWWSSKRFTVVAPVGSYGIEYAKENKLEFKEI